MKFLASFTLLLSSLAAVSGQYNQDPPTNLEPTDPPTSAPTGVPTGAPADPNAEVCTFQVERDLKGDGSTLLREFVNLEDETVTVEMTYRGLSWLGFSFSASDRMLGSIAVIGLPDQPNSDTNPAKYLLGSKTQLSAIELLDSTQQTLDDATISQNDTHTVLKFTKKLVEDDEVPISGTGPNFALFATGTSNALGEHGARGAFELELTPCGADAPENPTGRDGVELINGEVPNREMWLAHGLLMAAAWAILVPLAIGSSMLRDFVPFAPKTWFYLHAGLNSIAVFCVIAGFSIAVRNVNDETGPGEDANHFSKARHHTVGLVVFIFAVLQAANGLLRPHAPAKKPEPDVEGDEEEGAEEKAHQASEKTMFRTIWEYGHRLLGVSALALAWYNCDSGFEIFARRFGEDDKTPAFWGVAGGLSGAIVVVYVIQKLLKLKSSTE